MSTDRIEIAEACHNGHFRDFPDLRISFDLGRSVLRAVKYFVVHADRKNAVLSMVVL